MEFPQEKLSFRESVSEPVTSYRLISESDYFKLSMMEQILKYHSGLLIQCPDCGDILGWANCVSYRVHSVEKLLCAKCFDRRADKTIATVGVLEFAKAITEVIDGREVCSKLYPERE